MTRLFVRHVHQGANLRRPQEAMARDFAHDGDIARCELEGGRRRPLETGAMAPLRPKGLGHPISVSRLPAAMGHERGHRLVHLMPHLKERSTIFFSRIFNA